MTLGVQLNTGLDTGFIRFARLSVLCLGFWRATAKQNATIRDLCDCMADMSRSQAEASTRWEAVVDRLALREDPTRDER